MSYARNISESISLFAFSMGAYFSLLAYAETPLEQCLFLSPVTDMERIIKNTMSARLRYQRGTLESRK